jgi:hypothetical protein
MSSDQLSFEKTVVKSIEIAVREFRPLYIRCGKRTCCDYLYFYVRKGKAGKAELICNVFDAKHGGGDSITTADQTGLYKAVCMVESAVRDAKQVLGDIRLLFVSNRKRLTVPANRTDDQLAAEALFPMVRLELLNKDTFEFGPFSDILGARRKRVGAQRKQIQKKNSRIT